MVLGPQEDPIASNAEPLHWNMMRWQVDNDLEAEEALAHSGSAVTQDDRDAYTDRRRQDASVMKNEYSRQHEQRILRKRLEEQRQHRVFSGLQQAENKRNLRKLHSPVNTLDAQLKRYAHVPMGLPQTSREWLAEADKHEKTEEKNKHEKDEEYKSEEMRTIDVVSPKNDRHDE
jgi:septal ring factor EnvC (AmiA/AmiB activator)